VRRSRAPEGFYVDVEIAVTLGNGRRLSYAWSTTMGLSQALHKALSWAKENMHKEKIRGRSAIRHTTVTVELVEGDYDTLPGEEEEEGPEGGQ
jgi:hypothetical protein